MAKPTIGFGLALIILGLVGYMGSDPAPATGQDSALESDEQAPADGDAVATTDSGKPSPTALIPLMFGFPLLICGTLALQEKWLKHAMHGAAMFGLLGALGGLGKGIHGLVTGGNQRAMIFSLLLGVICAVFVFMCVKSFINARKRREAAAAS